MESLTKADKIIADIDVSKEILSTMPKNNEKNRNKRKEYINNLYNFFQLLETNR